MTVETKQHPATTSTTIDINVRKKFDTTTSTTTTVKMTTKMTGFENVFFKNVLSLHFSFLNVLSVTFSKQTNERSRTN